MSATIRQNPIPNAASTDQLSKNKSRITITLEDRIAGLGLLFVLALVYYIRSQFSEIPFERDEGAYAYYGTLLLEGKRPYIDFYEQKFPGLFYFYAGLVALFGDTVKGMHTGFIWVNLLTIVFLFFASRRLFSPMAGLISAVSFGIMSLNPQLSGYTIQGEHAVALFTSLALMLYMYARKSESWLLLGATGLSTGLAFMSKTSGVFMVALLGGLIILDFYHKGFWNCVKLLCAYGIGVALVVGFFFGLMAYLGSWHDMLFWTFEIPKNYVGKIKWDDGSQNCGKVFLKYMYGSIVTPYKWFWYHAFAAALIIFIKSFKSVKWHPLIVFACSAATVVPGFYFYGHYWIQVLPGLALLAAFTMQALLTLLKSFKLNFQVLSYWYAIVFLILVLIHINSKKDYYINPNYHQILRTVYGTNPFPESMEIANWINSHSKPNDGLVVIGSEPQLYFYTQKKCPSRHAYFAAIVDNVPQHKVWQREFVADVDRSKPKYLIFFNHGISLFRQANTDDFVFRWLDSTLRTQYQPVGLVDMMPGLMPSVYKWGMAEMSNYQAQGQERIIVYERK